MRGLSLPHLGWRRRGKGTFAVRALAVAFALALLVAAFLVIDRSDPPELLLFLGRFHPVIVHLPIGLLVLAALLEAFALFDPRWRSLGPATRLVLDIGAATAVCAVVAGYLLSLAGGYEEARLTRHMWLGLGVAAGALAAATLKRRLPRHGWVYEGGYRAVLFATVAAMIVAGHQGGSLAHGPGYLTYYLPQSFKDWLSLAAADAPRLTNIDSASVYRDLVAPILEARCTSCHGETKAEGGLRLDTPEGLFEGGDDGEVIVAGDPEGSELVRRITLSPLDEDAMPPDGAEPLDVGETELIRWWIGHGASTEQRVAEIEGMPTSVATLLNRLAPPRAEVKTGLYALEVEPADPAAMAALRNAGFGIGPVARDLALLHVTAANIRAAVQDDVLNLLAPVAAQVTWLDLGRTAVSDAGLAAVSSLPNLTRLNLAQTAVGDDGLRHLSALENLEYLNLVGSQVGDAGLEHLRGLHRLEAIYLWQTRVTDSGVSRLKVSLPDVRVVLGTELIPAADVP